MWIEAERENRRWKRRKRGRGGYETEYRAEE